MSALRSIGDAFRATLAPPHKEAFRFVAIGAVVGLAGLVYHSWIAFGVGAAFALFALFFFRDPVRVPPSRPGVLLAPADGLVTEVAAAVVPPAELGLGDEPMQRVATFLSVLDVHINRAPAAGVVRAVAYRKGRFLSANADKASDENERNAIAIDLPGGQTVVVVQIAGLVARRIMCWATPGATLAAGERFGLIRFGSRTDLYVPRGMTVLVEPGQRMIGGETVMATSVAAA